MTEAKQAIDWHQRAKTLIIDGRAFINGVRVEAVDKQTFECFSPIDNRKLADVASCQSADIDLAVAAARAAFNDRRWAGISPRERKQTMIRFADLLLANKEELALLETLDMGKPITASLNVDVNSAANSLRWFGEAIDKVYGEVAPTADNTLALITREPIGIVAAIVPWNYPILMACWKIAPALASGNSVVLKPSEKSPLTALRLGDLAKEAGIPAGVLNIVPGFGAEAGTPLAMHMDVDCIAFTGSTGVGKKIQIMAGQSNLKRAWCELGGKSANIVFEDARIEDALSGAISGIFAASGQTCIAGSRLLVHESIHDVFVQKLVALASTARFGDPMSADTQLGPITTEQQYRKVLDYIEIAKNEGAHCVMGGAVAKGPEGANGFFVQPTIFVNVTPDMRIAQEEVFGPVLSVIKFKDDDDAVRIANATQYGLAAGVWTENLRRAVDMSNRLVAGTVWINIYRSTSYTSPFGGFKSSGMGRENGMDAIYDYLQVKSVWIYTGGPAANPYIRR
jgi:acyl-CoA reductase-like NAD-dependent aldehyde dehydrogenase